MNKTTKAILSKTDGYSISHYFFDSFEAAKIAMDNQYAELTPDEWVEDFEDMSYCGTHNATLYRNGEDVYVWQIVELPTSTPEIATEGDDTVREVSIKRIINGVECNIELTESEIERIFRYQDEGYMKEDAKNHLFECAGIDRYDEDGEDVDELKAEFRENYGADFDILVNNDDTLSALASDFSEEQDCNVAENSTWDYVVQEYLSRVKGSVINATFVSIWDGGTEIASPCKVNTLTMEIFDVEKVDPVCDVNVLDGEYVKIGEELFGACSKEDADTCPGYWYWYR